jgi:hypothetical protein
MPDLENPPIEMKVYLNGFPKAGVHLLELYIHTFVDRMPTDGIFNDWAGTFRFHAWGSAWVPLNQTAFAIGRIEPNKYIKGHAGYQPELERFMWYLGVSHIFVFRDLRDVAVSEAFHIMSDNPAWYHPAKDRYRVLGGFNEILEAVILGHQEFPSVLSRWQYYMSWLSVPWTYCVRFEDLINEREKCAEQMFDYCLERSAHVFGLKPQLKDEQREAVLKKMVENSYQTKLSSTFREGKTGGWKEHFTERHVKLFKEQDKYKVLAHLGYTDGDDW